MRWSRFNATAIASLLVVLTAQLAPASSSLPSLRRGIRSFRGVVVQRVWTDDCHAGDYDRDPRISIEAVQEGSAQGARRSVRASHSGPMLPSEEAVVTPFAVSVLPQRPCSQAVLTRPHLATLCRGPPSA